jgi:isoaspartyl peptidase/L-asparaginase-like protein (Ntn-hydrolase superfamily)
MEDTDDAPRRFVIAIHGGVSDSGGKDKVFEDAAKVALTDTIDLALKRLVDGEPALQVAEAAVAALEDATVFNTEHRRTQTHIPLQSEDPNFGTVGAVVLDIYGNLAAASSTGGLHGKEPSRIGDTANPGAGIWADHSSAIIW